MHQKLVIIGLLLNLFFVSCSGDKAGTQTTNKTTNSNSVNNTDSSTTNPVNSEYGTPNASENPVDSAQNINRKNE